MSDFDTYQEGTRRTAGSDDLAVLALGLCGEAGEAADVIKKHIGQGHELDKDKLLRELGDQLWYLARMADVLGTKLSEVAEKNRLKLLSRYPDKFTPEASINRSQNEK